MKKYLSKIFAMAGVIIPIMATFAITSFFTDRKEVHITLDVSENTNIATRIRNEIEFDTPATNIFIVKNNGDIDIRDNDFLEPIVIEPYAFKWKRIFLGFYDTYKIDEITINNAFVSDKDDKINYDLENNIAIENNCIIIRKFNLLKNEEFKITLTSDYMITNFKVDTRILGIDNLKKSVIINGSFLYVVIAVCSFLLMLIMIPFLKHESAFKFAIFIIGILIVIFITSLILVFLASFK